MTTAARIVEDYINSHFYVYNDAVSGDDQLHYVIEEAKAKYDIRVYGIVISVDPDIGSGATKKRAKQIQQELDSLITR